MQQYARQPRVLVIQDISLIGRCSSLTALPVLSCAGINVTLLPTALLSTHTGGFPSPFRRILTDDMQCILDKWSPLPVAFDAIYVGYLASEDQFAVVERVLKLVRTSEWKRHQAAPGPKVSRRAFGRDRRYPITNGYKE